MNSHPHPCVKMRVLHKHKGISIFISEMLEAILSLSSCFKIVLEPSLTPVH